MARISKHSGRIEIRPGLKAIADAKAAWHAAYRSACKHDGIPEDSKFTIFSDDNPFNQFVDAGFKEYCARVNEYQSGGYIGLRIGS